MRYAIVWLLGLLLTTSVLAQQVPSQTGSSILQAQAQEALDFHNKVRKEVGNEPLEWSSELSAYAQRWADSLAMRDCAFEHRPYYPGKKNYGENIFWGSATTYTPADASQSWYDEIKDYVYGPLTESNWYKTGHYTQMVWYSTKSVGMGIGTCSDGAVIIVANYDPAGNYMGQTPYKK